MAGERVMMSALIPVGFQVITQTNSTSVAVNTTCRKGSVLDISIETQAARYRADGTNPTINTGVVLQKDATFRLEGFNGTSVLKFIRTTGSTKISIMAYKYPGDGR